MVNNTFRIKLEVRCRASKFEADSISELYYLLSKELFRLDILGTPNSTQSASAHNVEKLIQQYRREYRNRTQTPIFRADLEEEVAKCYLARMTLKQTVNLLKKEKGFRTSISALGRYFAKFKQLPAGMG